MREVYADHSATTYVKKDVLEEMLPYYTSKYGNPSSIYTKGLEVKEAINIARKKVANVINCCEDEIYFTSCGSESDNTAIIGIARANKDKGNHIITTKIEHLAIINSCKFLEKEGFEVTYLGVDKTGIIDIDELNKSIKENTILISVMYANNEIGTLQPIEEIGRIAKEKNIIFHSDCVQTIGTLEVDVKKFNLDSISLSAHKFYGPKGVGALYIRDGIKFESLIHGGHQEDNKRAGTENTSGIVGIGKAIEIANSNREEYYKYLLILRKYMIEKLDENSIEYNINGSLEKRLPGNLNICFNNIDCNALLLKLSTKGIYVSCGSACNSANPKPSHVLTALGLNEKEVSSSMRFTFGEDNTFSDIDYIVYNIKEFIQNNQ